MGPTVGANLPEVNLSLGEALKPQLAGLQQRFAADAEVIALPLETSYRFQCRVHGTDIPVIFDTLVGLYHVPPVPLTKQPVIVDLGANIGCTMVHFATLYPNARIVGVELDAENVRLARINTAAIPDHATLFHSAIWPHDGTVAYSGDEAWGYHVASTGDRPVEALSMLSLIARAELSTIDFLKVDIEGGERELFEGELPWLAAVNAIAIEVHNDKPFIHRLVALLRRHGFQAMRDTRHWSAVIGARIGRAL